MISWIAISVSRSTADVANARPRRVSEWWSVRGAKATYLHPVREFSIYVGERARSKAAAAGQRKAKSRPLLRPHLSRRRGTPQTTLGGSNVKLGQPRDTSFTGLRAYLLKSDPNIGIARSTQGVNVITDGALEEVWALRDDRYRRAHWVGQSDDTGKRLFVGQLTVMEPNFGNVHTVYVYTSG